MIKILFLSVLFSTLLISADAYEAATIDEKRKELAILKAEFDEYYKNQEDILKKQINTIALKNLLISKKEKNIKKLLEENQQLLKEIKQEVFNKTIKVYNYMKAKDVSKIFTQMISEHNIQKVYSIMIKLKSQQTVKILRLLSQKNSSLLTQMMLNGEKPKLKDKEN